MTSTRQLFIHITSFKKTRYGDQGYLPSSNSIIGLDRDGIIWYYGTPSQYKIPFRIIAFDSLIQPIFDTTWIDDINDRKHKKSKRTYRYELGNWNILTPDGVILKATLKIYKYFGICSPTKRYCQHYGYEYYRPYDINEDLIFHQQLENTNTLPPPIIDEHSFPERKYKPLYHNDIFAYDPKDMKSISQTKTTQVL